MSVDLWLVFVECFALGMVAFTLPCIFPLAPLTVSFFTKKSEAGQPILASALWYAAAIVLIYVSLGLLITLLFGAGALNELASDGLLNIFLFSILMLFGVSLLGAFDLNLPNSWVNRIAEKSQAHSAGGIFFMAVTLAVVSFSCTGPVIGSILVTVGITGGLLAPAVGMLGFSLALAGIFLFLALFPHWLKHLPRSGAWLNTIKVSLGFLEIALAFKFLSTADLAYHWNLLSREIFLVIWICLSASWGFNLLGKLRLPHDGVIEVITIPRLMWAMTAFAFSLILMTGLWGAPLHGLSGFLPPHKSTAVETPITLAKKKYSDLLTMPHQIDGYFDYEEALAFAKRVRKPLLLDFTGHGCVNCRKMEAEVWSQASILPLLRERYVVVSLYTDDKTALPANEQFDSTILKTRVDTIGKKFKHLQASRFNTLSQPYYVLLDTQEKLLVTPPIGVELDVKLYRAYLDRGLAEFGLRGR